jgi:ABC-type transport system involved in multi-copper enzyme maturation permease subunit
MVCLPLIERELRVALRKQRPAQGRFKVAALSVACSMLWLGYAALSGDRGVGLPLELGLCVAGLYFVVQVPMLTAGALAEERRNQTLGLLFLSGLGAVEVFASKFLSSALIAFTNLLAIFPMLALPFLLGGVSYPLFIAIICGLPVLMLFALALSLLASVLTREDTTAVVLANVLGALLCALPPAVYLVESHFSPLARPSLWWLRMSPAYGPFLVGRGFTSGFRASEQAEFWPNLALTVGWAVSALGAAAFALKRVWRERDEEEGISVWRGKWREFVHGGRESRRRLGRAWLDENPFAWLAGRDRQPAMLCWLVIGGIVVAWLLCWAVWPGQWLTAINTFVTALLLNTVLAWLTRFAAAQAVSQGRRDGTYELLLTTPLTPGEIAQGTLVSLRWRFRGVAAFVMSLNVLLMLGGEAARRWTAGALFVYLSLWLCLLAWTWSLGHRWGRMFPVMWASLNCGRPAYAVWRATGSGASGSRWYLWIWIFNLYNMRNVRLGFQNFPTGSRGEIVFASCFTFIWLIWLVKGGFASRGKVGDYRWDPGAKDWLPVRSPDLRKPYEVSSWMRSDKWGAHSPVFRPNVQLERGCQSRLVAEFREIAREPLPEPNDPGFKKWNVQERFPGRPTEFEPARRSYPSPGDEEARTIEVVIVELIRSGDKSAAVKLARELYGYSLYQAVAYVENLDTGDGKPPEPGKKPAPPSRSV